MGIRKGEKRQERCAGEKVQFYSLFSKEAVVITKVDQGLVIKSKAAETISHCKALKTYVFSWKHWENSENTLLWSDDILWYDEVG